MTINLKVPDIHELKPRITVFGCGGAGGNAVNNMITAGLVGCDFVVGNTDAQALMQSKAERRIQMGLAVTQGLGAGSHPEIGKAAAEEVIDEIRDQLSGAHMVFITAGMGGGTGTGAAPVVARAARDLGILTVGVVTKPFHFEGQRRMRLAEAGIQDLQAAVDTLIVIPNQNLFRVANERTTFADAFAMADQVLYSGVACITDLMVKEGLINLDFADVRAVMREMGKAMMGTGEATGDKRALTAAEAAISNPLLDEVSMKGARGLLISITGGRDMTLYEVDEAATRIREEVDQEANIIMGATFDDALEGTIRVSVVATGIDQMPGVRHADHAATDRRLVEAAEQVAREARARGIDPDRIASSRRLAPVAVAESIARETTARLADPAPRVEIQPEPVMEVPQPEPEPVTAPMAVEVRHEPVVQVAPPQPEPVWHEPAPVVRQPVARQPEPPPQLPLPVREPPPVLQPMQQAERMVPRPVKMPPIEEFPRPVRDQLMGRGEAATPDTKRMTLLQKLAAVSLLRREEPAVEPTVPQTVAVQPAAPTPAHAHYARRDPQPPRASAPQGQLDSHGRAPKPARIIEDEHLEIPAFLRRQAN